MITDETKKVAQSIGVSSDKVESTIAKAGDPDLAGPVAKNIKNPVPTTKYPALSTDGSIPTSSAVLGRIGDAYRNGDTKQATQLFNDYYNLTRNPNSAYYNPYSTSATNSAVLNNLSALTGNDYSKGITGDEIDRLWNQYGNQYVATNTGGISSSKKNGTGAQIAYYLNQLAADEKTTVAAESELKNLQSEVSYWVSRGYSDAQIQEKIDWSKYKTLPKASENSSTAGQLPTQFNRVINWYGAEDTVNGMIYAARSAADGETPAFRGTNDVFLFYGMGSGYKADRHSEAARDRNTGETWHPYSYGASDTKNMNAICREFGITEFDKKWVEEHEAELTEKGMYGDALKAAKNYEECKGALDTLNTTVDNLIAKKLANGEEVTAESIMTTVNYMIENDSTYKPLKDMEEKRQGKAAMDISGTVDFTPYYYKQDVEKKIRKATYEKDKADYEELLTVADEDTIWYINHAMNLAEGNPDGTKHTAGQIKKYVEDNNLQRTEGMTQEEYETVLSNHGIQVKREAEARATEKAKEEARAVVATPNFSMKSVYDNVDGQDENDNLDDIGNIRDSVILGLQGRADEITDPNGKAWWETYGNDLTSGTVWRGVTSEDTEFGYASQIFDNQRANLFGDEIDGFMSQADDAWRDKVISGFQYGDYLMQMSALEDEYGGVAGLVAEYNKELANPNGEHPVMDVVQGLTGTISENKAAIETQRIEKGQANVVACNALRNKPANEFTSADMVLQGQLDAVDLSKVNDPDYKAAINNCVDYCDENIANLGEVQGWDETAYWASSDAVSYAANIRIGDVMRAAAVSGITFNQALEALGYTSVNELIDDTVKTTFTSYGTAYNATADTVNAITNMIKGENVNRFDDTTGSFDYKGTLTEEAMNGRIDELTANGTLSAESADSFRQFYNAADDERKREIRGQFTETDDFENDLDNLFAATASDTAEARYNDYVSNLDASNMYAPRGVEGDDKGGYWAALGMGAKGGVLLHGTTLADTYMALVTQDSAHREATYRQQYKDRVDMRAAVQSQIDKIADPEFRAIVQQQFDEWDGDIYDFKVDINTLSTQSWKAGLEKKLALLNEEAQDVLTPSEYKFYTSVQTTTNSALVSGETAFLMAALQGAGMSATLANVIANVVVTGSTESSSTVLGLLDSGVDQNTARFMGMSHAVTAGLTEACLDTTINWFAYKTGLGRFVDNFVDFDAPYTASLWGSAVAGNVAKKTGSEALGGILGTITNYGSHFLLNSAQELIKSAVSEPFQEGLEEFEGQFFTGAGKFISGVGNFFDSFDAEAIIDTMGETFKNTFTQFFLGGGVYGNITQAAIGASTNLVNRGKSAITGKQYTPTEGGIKQFINGIRNFKGWREDMLAMDERTASENAVAERAYTKVTDTINGIRENINATASIKNENLADEYSMWLDEAYAKAEADYLASQEGVNAMAEINDGELGEAVRTAGAEVETAQAEVTKAQEALKNSEDLLAQQENELMASQTPGSQNDNSLKLYTSAQQAVQTARNALANAQNILATATANLQTAVQARSNAFKAAMDVARANAKAAVDAKRAEKAATIEAERETNINAIREKAKEALDKLNITKAGNKARANAYINNLRSKYEGANGWFVEMARGMADRLGGDIIEHYVENETKAKIKVADMVRQYFRGWSVKVESIENGAAAYTDVNNHAVVLNADTSIQEWFGGILAHEMVHMAEKSSKYLAYADSLIKAFYKGKNTTAYKEAEDFVRGRMTGKGKKATAEEKAALDQREVDSEVVTYTTERLFNEGEWAGDKGRDTLQSVFSKMLAESGQVEFAKDIYSMLLKQAQNIKQLNSKDGWFKKQLNKQQVGYAKLIVELGDMLKGYSEELANAPSETAQNGAVTGNTEQTENESTEAEKPVNEPVQGENQLATANEQAAPTAKTETPLEADEISETASTAMAGVQQLNPSDTVEGTMEDEAPELPADKTEEYKEAAKELFGQTEEEKASATPVSNAEEYTNAVKNGEAVEFSDDAKAELPPFIHDPKTDEFTLADNATDDLTPENKAIVEAAVETGTEAEYNAALAGDASKVWDEEAESRRLETLNDLKASYINLAQKLDDTYTLEDLDGAAQIFMEDGIIKPEDEKIINEWRNGKDTTIPTKAPDVAKPENDVDIADRWNYQGTTKTGKPTTAYTDTSVKPYYNTHWDEFRYARDMAFILAGEESYYTPPTSYFIDSTKTGPGEDSILKRSGTNITPELANLEKWFKSYDEMFAGLTEFVRAYDEGRPLKNNAKMKHIEETVHDALMNGYKAIDPVLSTQPNQDYIALRDGKTEANTGVYYDASEADEATNVQYSKTVFDKDAIEFLENFEDIGDVSEFAKDGESVSDFFDRAKKGLYKYYAVFDPTQIKSADLDTGVPLSQRFDDTNPDIRFSKSFGNLADRARDMLIDAYNSLAGQAIEAGDVNTYRQMMGRMYGQLSKYKNRQGMKLNTPLGIVRLLASDIGTGIFEGVRGRNVEVPVGTMDDGSPIMMNTRIQSEFNTWSNAITTDAVNGRNLAAVMGSIADAVFKQFTDSGVLSGNITSDETAQQFGEWFFQYMTHSDAQLGQATTAYGKVFKDAVENSDNKNLKAMWDAVENRRSQLVQFILANDADKIGAYMVSKANRMANPDRNWHEKIRSFLTSWVDRSQIATVVDEQAGNHALQNAVLYSPYMQRRAERVLSGKRFVDVDGHDTGFKTFATYMEESGMEPSKANYTEFNKYLAAKAAIDRDENGMPAFDNEGEENATFNFAPTRENLDNYAAEIEATRPDIVRAAEGYWEFNRNFIETYLVNEGLLDRATWREWQDRTPHYASLKRFMGDPSANASTARGNALGVTFQRYRGNSNRQIINPVESMTDMVHAVVNGVVSNRVKQAFSEQFEGNPNMGSVASRVNAEDINIHDPDVIAVHFYNPVRTNEENANDGSQTQELPDNGIETRYYKIKNRELYNLLTGIDPNTAVDTFRKVGKWTRSMTMLTTGVNALFSLKNAARDFQHSVNYGSWASNYVTGAVKWMSAYMDMRKELKNGTGSQQAKDYIDLGGGEWERIGTNDNKSVNELRKELFGRTKIEKIGHKIYETMTFADFNAQIEAASRFAEYKYGKSDVSETASDESKLKAFMAAQEATVDFQRGGNGSGIVIARRLIPFLNATMQGNYQDIRVLTDAFKGGEDGKRAKTVLAKSFMNHALSGALFALLNLTIGSDDDKDEYLNMDDGVKQDYALIPMRRILESIAGKDFANSIFGGRDMVRIPVSSSGLEHIMYNFGRSMVEDMYQGKKVPEMGADIASIAWDSIKDSYADITTVISPLWQVGTNKAWYGDKLIADRTKDSYKEDSSLWANDTSTGISRGIARALQSVIGNSNFASPIGLDYIFQQYSGIIGQMLIPMLSPNKYTGENIFNPSEVTGIKPVDSVLYMFGNAANTALKSYTIDSDSTSQVGDQYDKFSDRLETVLNVGKYGTSIPTFMKSGMSDEFYTQAYEDALAMTSKGGILYEADKEISAQWSKRSAILRGEEVDGVDYSKYSMKDRERLAEDCNTEIRHIKEGCTQAIGEYEEKYFSSHRLINAFSQYGEMKPLDKSERNINALSEDMQSAYDNGETWMTTSKNLYDRYHEENGSYAASLMPHYTYSFKNGGKDYKVPESMQAEYNAVYDEAYRTKAMTIEASIESAEDPYKVWTQVHDYAYKTAKTWFIANNPLDN